LRYKRKKLNESGRNQKCVTFAKNFYLLTGTHIDSAPLSNIEWVALTHPGWLKNAPEDSWTTFGIFNRRVTSQTGDITIDDK